MSPIKNSSSCASIAAVDVLAAQCLSILTTDQTRLQDYSGTAAYISSLTTNLARGDEAAYRQFFELYFDRLLRYLLVVTCDEQIARDALQLTLLRVVKHVKTFDSEENFWSWLTVLARSAAIDEQRKTGRYLFFLTRFFRDKQMEQAVAEPDGESELIRLLECNVALLADEERDLLRRKYYNGESVRDIAQQLHTTEKAVESRLTRARAKLKQSILTQLKHGR